MTEKEIELIVQAAARAPLPGGLVQGKILSDALEKLAAYPFPKGVKAP